MPQWLTTTLVACAMLGCESWPDEPFEPVHLEVRLARFEPVPGDFDFGVVAPDTGDKVYLADYRILTNMDVSHASAEIREGSPTVILRIEEASRPSLIEETRRHVGHPIAVIIGDDLVAVAQVNTALADTIAFSGGFSLAEAELLAKRIMLGKPRPLAP